MLGVPTDPNEMMFLDIDRFLDSKSEKRLFRDGVAAAQNFFKHGNTDAKATFALDTRLTEGLLLDAAQKYALLAGEFPSTIVLYALWYATRHPNGINRAEMPDSLRKYFERFLHRAPSDRRKFYVEALPTAKAISKGFSA